MEVVFWGVRGSIPTPGPETVRYGGNTLCVEVRTRRMGRILLDAGTGLAVLGGQLMRESFGRGVGEASIFLSHAHMDHIQGFPFFAPVYVPGNRFSIYGLEQAPGLLERVLEGQMHPNFSPIHSLRNLGATILLHPLQEGHPVRLHGVRLTHHTNPHGQTTALAFRLTEGRRSLVYASDVGYPGGVPTAEAVAFYRGADLLIHDATYSPEDYRERVDRGFSSVDHAVMAAIQAGVKVLALVHYDQDYSDDDVDQMAGYARQRLDAQGGKGIELVAAFEGLRLPV